MVSSWLEKDNGERNIQGAEFTRLFAEHERRLFSYILSLIPNRTAAEEVFQDTCLIMWQKFTEFEPDTNFTAWAYRIAYFRVLKYREQQGRQMPLLTNDFLEAVSRARRAQHDNHAQRHEALVQCVKGLSQRDQELLVRRYSEDMPAKQVAEQLGRPANTVYKALGRIRRTLLECVQRALMREAHE